MESPEHNSAYSSIPTNLYQQTCFQLVNIVHLFFSGHANLSYNFTNLVLLTSLPLLSMVGNMYSVRGGGKGFVFIESLCRVVPACWWCCHKQGGFTHDCNNYCILTEYIVLGAGTSPPMSTGCLAPLATMVIPGNQYSNFTFIIFIVIICLARMSTNKDCCCC